MSKKHNHHGTPPRPTRRALMIGAGSMMLAQPLAASEPVAQPDSFVQTGRRLPSPRIDLPTDALPKPTGPKKRLAAICTAYWKYSHSDNIVTRFIEGYSVVGRSHLPHCKVVSLYIDQFPKTDIGRALAARYNIPLKETPAAALTLGEDKLAIDGILLIGEHGDYPLNEKGQKEYPRRRLFEEIVKVFQRTRRSVPVFNDKHLSYSWENAKWMYDQSRKLKFPMMAGSSVPVTWRRPALQLRRGVPLKSALVVGSGSFESYGFHCLELLQAFVERRRGACGVKSVQALEGDAVAAAAKQGLWPAHLVPAALVPVPAARKRTYDPEKLHGTFVFLIEYQDGFRAAVCMANRFVSEFCFAGEIEGRDEPVATWAYLPKPQRDHFSFLCNHVEVMFRSSRPSYPVERTLLVTGVLDALHDSRFARGAKVETPHLADIRY